MEHKYKIMKKYNSDYGPYQELMPDGKTKVSATKRNADRAFYVAVIFALLELLGYAKGQYTFYTILTFLGFSLGAKVFLALPSLVDSFKTIKTQ